MVELKRVGEKMMPAWHELKLLCEKSDATDSESFSAHIYKTWH